MNVLGTHGDVSLLQERILANLVRLALAAAGAERSTTTLPSEVSERVSE